MTPLPLHDAGTLPGKDTPDIFQHILFKDGADLRQKSPDMAQRINPIGTAVYGDADQHASEPHPPSCTLSRISGAPSATSSMRSGREA